VCKNGSDKKGGLIPPNASEGVVFYFSKGTNTVSGTFFKFKNIICKQRFGYSFFFSISVFEILRLRKFLVKIIASDFINVF